MTTVYITASGKRHTIEIDERFLSEIGISASDPNKDTVSLFLASWFALLSDSPLKKQRKPWRSYFMMKKILIKHGVKGTVVLFSDLAHRMVADSVYLGIEYGTTIGALLEDMKDTPVFQEYHFLSDMTPSEARRYEGTGEIESVFSWLYTFLNFGKKLDYVDQEFNVTALRGWLDVEKRLDRLQLEDNDLSFLDSSSKLYSHVSNGQILDQSLVLGVSKNGESRVVLTKYVRCNTMPESIGSYSKATLESMEWVGTSGLGWIKFYLIRPNGRLKVVYRLGLLA